MVKEGREDTRRELLSKKQVFWLVYTVALGLIPVFARLLVCMFLPKQSSPIPYFASTDFVAFGIIVHASILNEVMSNKVFTAKVRIVHGGFSIFLLMFYGINYGFSLIPENQENVLILVAALIAAFVSVMLGVSVFFSSLIRRPGK